jgi:uncharacterized protein YjiS (DUF1127 family)
VYEESVVTISILPAMTRKPRNEAGFSFPALATIVRTFRARHANRRTMRQLDAVPQATLKDIGITRPEVFAGVHGYLNAA